MAELHLYDIIRRPVVSEKSSLIAEELNQYAFEVAQEANKEQISNPDLIYPGQVFSVPAGN